MKMSKIFFGCMLAAVFTLTSCIKDSLIVEPSYGNEVSMTLTANVQGSDATQSRAIGHGEEIKLFDNKVKVLAFDNSGNFLYMKDGDVTDNSVFGDADKGAGNATIKFLVLSSVNPVTFVVIANVTAEITTALSGVAEGTPKATVLGNAVFTKSNTGKWNTTSSSDYTPIPMHGELTVSSIPNSGLTEDITLRRMLARVNVIVDPAARSTFKLESIHVYNYNTSGLIIPNVSSFVPANYSGVYTTPSIPSSPGKTNASTSSTSLNYTTNSDNKIDCTNQIYIFENAHVAPFYSGSWKNNPCLVIGGKFGTGTQPTTYYRQDFVRKGSPDEWFSVLRNHSYLFTIKDVVGPGYDTPIKALLAEAEVPININVQSWNDADIENVVVDELSYLGATPRSFNLSNTSGHSGNVLTITTSRAAQPTVTFSSSATAITAITPAGWMAQTSYPATYTTVAGRRVYTYTFNVAGSGTRTGYIHIKAGRMTSVVEVRQAAP